MIISIIINIAMVIMILIMCEATSCVTNVLTFVPCQDFSAYLLLLYIEFWCRDGPSGTKQNLSTNLSFGIDIVIISV